LKVEEFYNLIKMKHLIIILSLSIFISCKSESQPTVFPAAYELIHRVVPQIEDKLIVDSIPPEKGKDAFEISSKGNKIVLAGSSPVAIASALNWYLKYFCHCQLSQAGSNLQLPDQLPVLKEKIRIVSPYKYRYFLNYCTFNYTMSFWGWKEWQHELDWMAMQGVNLVLAINGTEEVWQNTLKKLNFSDKEISDFICGPAYQAWWLMDNLEGWGGPVSQKWIKNRTSLQRNILSYMKEMGMEPVLQGFYGMVPTAFKAKFSKADIRSTGFWGEFKRPDFVMPTDSAFNFIAQTYYQELEKLYGKAHFYGGDPFHEGSILNVDLPACGSKIQQAMQKAVPGSTWVLQGWMDNPSPKMLQGLDKDQTLVIDLFCETNKTWQIRKGFDGCRWLFCTIDNFGGRTGLYGKIDSTTMSLDEARKSAYGQRLEGIGVIPEAIHLNPFIFEYIFELGWRDQLPVPEKWAQDYTTFRYGKDLQHARKAWQLLSRSVYNIPMHCDEPQDVICSRPSLDWQRSAPWGNGPIQYKQEELRSACRELLACKEDLKSVDTYQYDVVDIVHQYMLGFAENKYHEMVAAFKARNEEGFTNSSTQFLSLIKDFDILMSTRKEFMLGRWIKEARDVAPTSTEKGLFERNARMLITTWGYGKPHEILNDYAHREWGGLMNSLYLGRWQMFIEDMKGQLNNKPPQKIKYEAFEEEWTKKGDKYPSEPIGNAVDIALKMFEKYK
jgi:alpha-N-acetylglucosaminidase